MGAVRLSCMINLILAGAAFLTQAMAYSGIPGRWRPGSARRASAPS